jgi:hypothetical protein
MSCKAHDDDDDDDDDMILFKNIIWLIKKLIIGI